jgi:hypothetical protein
MNLSVTGPGPLAPFLSARDRFETAYDLSDPVDVRIREDPDERTWTRHDGDGHLLNISRRAATSALAVELALHEFSHMRRYEEGHPSHTQSTKEAISLALAGQQVERRKLAHCYQIANHLKDIYADDLTFSVGPVNKLVPFFESALAATLTDHQPARPAEGNRLTATSDPDMTAINAAFALALLERNDAIPEDHHIYDLAAAADRDAPGVEIATFKQRFRELGDVDTSEYRQVLVDVFREYTAARPAAAAD